MKRPSPAVLIIFFAAVVVLAWPALRAIALLQITGSPLCKASVWPSARRISDIEGAWDAAAKRDPGNIAVAVIDIETQYRHDLASLDGYDDEEEEDYYDSYYARYAPGRGSSDPHAEITARAYDRLINRGGDRKYLPLLLARRIQFSFAYLQWPRLFNNGVMGRKARRELAELERVCRRGQKLEPDNAYFDWSLCKVFFASRRIKEAEALLAALTAKSRFDSHEAQLWQCRIAAYEAVLRRPLLLEEKWNCWRSFSLFDGFEKSALFAMSGQRRSAFRAGKTKQALWWSEKIIRVHTCLWQHKVSSTEITDDYEEDYSNRFDLFSEISLGLPGRITYPRAGQQTHMGTFQVYARKHGRTDLAQLAAQSAADAKKMNTSRYRWREAPTALPSQQYFFVKTAWHLQTTLLLLMLGGLLSLGAAHALLERVLKRTSGHDSIIPSREVAGGLLACYGLRGLVCILWAAIIGGSVSLAGMIVVGEQDVLAQGYQDLLSSLSGVNFWEEIWQALSDAAGGIGNYTYYWRAALFFWPFLVVTPYALWRAVRRQRLQSSQADDPGFWAFVRGVASGRIWKDDYDYDFTRAFLRIVDLAFTLAFLAAWFTFAFWSDPQTLWWIFPLGLMVLFYAVLVYGNFYRWRRLPRRREAARYALTLARTSLVAFLVSNAILYLVVGIALLPLRSLAQQRLDGVLREGEVQVLLKKEE